MATRRPRLTYKVWGDILAVRDGGFFCHYCHAPLIPPSSMLYPPPVDPCAVPGSVDHMTPLCRGGIRQKANLVLACRACNAEKGEMTKAEYLATRIKKVLSNK